MNDEYILEKAISIHKKMWPLFTYVYDKDQYMQEEHWTSHAQAVNENRGFRDDCDGYACTAAELLVEAGIPRENIKLVYCKTETGEGHLVCGVSSDSTTYIIENRFSVVYDWKRKTNYQWIYFMELSEPGTWNKITNG